MGSVSGAGGPSIPRPVEAAASAPADNKGADKATSDDTGAVGGAKAGAEALNETLPRSKAKDAPAPRADDKAADAPAPKKKDTAADATAPSAENTAAAETDTPAASAPGQTEPVQNAPASDTVDEATTATADERVAGATVTAADATDVAAATTTGTEATTPVVAGLADARAAVEDLAAPDAPSSQELINTVANQSKKSDVAQYMLTLMKPNSRRDGANIEVKDDAAPSAAANGSTNNASSVVDAYDPTTKRIVVSQSTVSDPTRLRDTVLHAGVRWLQDRLSDGLNSMGSWANMPLTRELDKAGVRDTSLKWTPTKPAATPESIQRDLVQASVIDAAIARQLGT